MARRIKRYKKSDAEERFFSVGENDVRYSLFRSPRRRTMEVSVDDEMQIRVVVPRYVSGKDVDIFLLEKSSWILARLKEANENQKILNKRQYCHGSEFLFLGKNYPLVVEEGSQKRASIDFDGEGWIVRLPLGFEENIKKKVIKAQLKKWYQDQAKEVLGGRIFHFERIMGMEPKEIAVRGQKRVWGTCGFHERRVSLNWQLILAPMAVIDYVVVHELAHLKTPDHSKKFWSTVGEFMPDYKKRKNWLKDNRLEMVLP